MCSFSKEKYQLMSPKTKHKGDLFTPEGQRVGNKRQSQEIEDQERKQGRGGRSVCPRGGGKELLPLDREETDEAHRQIMV